MWIAYTDDHTIWGTGDSEEAALLDSIRHSEGIDDVAAEGVATVRATRAVVLLVDALGGNVDDWAAAGVSWALVDGVATIRDQG